MSIASTNSPFFDKIRKAVLFIGVAAALFYLFYWMFLMSGKYSLSADEFGTISAYSSRGPFVVMSHYPAPKNHIFFNLVNSIYPFGNSYALPRARIISMLAVLATVICAVRFLARRNLYFACFVFLGFWLVNPETHLMLMQARGYGLMGLFAVLSFIFSSRYLDSGEERPFIALCICTVLGIYTVPTYAVFGASILGCTWLAQPNRRMFRAAVIAMLVTIALYLPVIAQVVKSFHKYSESMGKTFESFAGIQLFLHLYALPTIGEKSINVWYVFGGLALGVALLWKEKSAFKFALCAFVTCVVFFVYCLWQQTLPMRTAAFMGAPVVFLMVFLCDKAVLQRIPWKLPLLLLEIGVCVLLLGGVMEHYKTDNFLPFEDWSLARKTTEFLTGVDGEIFIDDSYKNENAKNFRFVVDRRTKVHEIKDASRPNGVLVGAMRTWKSSDPEFQPFSDHGWNFIRLPGLHKRIIINIPSTLLKDQSVVSVVGKMDDASLPITMEGMETMLQPSEKPYVAGFQFSNAAEGFFQVESWNGSAWKPLAKAQYINVSDYILVHSSDKPLKLRFLPRTLANSPALVQVWIFQSK
ncbi:MAG: hypothetical protein ABIP97_12460 [Chthoniobacterales bacterium]